MNSRKATELLPPPSLLSFSHSGYSTVKELDTTICHPGLGTNKLTTIQYGADTCSSLAHIYVTDSVTYNFGQTLRMLPGVSEPAS